MNDNVRVTPLKNRAKAFQKRTYLDNDEQPILTPIQKRGPVRARMTVSFTTTVNKVGLQYVRDQLEKELRVRFNDPELEIHIS